MKAFSNMHIRGNDIRDIAFGRQSGPAGINIATICPDESGPRIERTTRNAQLLRAAAIASAQRTLRAFGHPVEEVVELLRPFPALERDCEPPARGSGSR